jgi:hypothetical protein
MTLDPNVDLEALRQSIGELKREAAKVIAAMQFGGDRRKRRELTRRLESCRRRARGLSREAAALLHSVAGEPERGELEKHLTFLDQLSVLGARDKTDAEKTQP